MTGRWPPKATTAAVWSYAVLVLGLLAVVLYEGLAQRRLGPAAVLFLASQAVFWAVYMTQRR